MQDSRLKAACSIRFMIHAESTQPILLTVRSGPFTIFAPYNDAFAAIPADDLNAILADNDLLTSILTYHVVAGESLDLADLIAAGSVTTVQGDTLVIEASGDLATVQGANVICGNVQTANATVHIIDAVLVPMG